jgi:hypothetical protein
MQRPPDLSRYELERVVDELQQALYLKYDDDTEAFVWDPDKEWSGFDVCDCLAGLLSQFSLAPEERKPFES